MAGVSKRVTRWTTSSGEVKTAARWQAEYRDRHGKRHRKLGFARKVDAQRWLDEQTASLVIGRWVDPQAGKQTLGAYASGWLARQVVAASTGDAYETVVNRHVLPTLGEMRLDGISQADIQSLVKTWSNSAAPATVELRYNVLAMVLKGAVRDRKIPETPCEGIKLPQRKAKAALVPISTETVLALRDAMPRRYRNFVTVAAGTGMRRGELLGLTLDRVSEPFGTIRIDRQASRRATGDEVVWIPPKREASVRTIPVAEVVIDAIREHVESFGTHRSGLIFTSEIGSPVRTSTLWMAWKRAATAIGTDATPHDLRHYFASVQIAAGTSIKSLQRLLGHKSAVETLDVYGHLIGDEDERSRVAVQNLLGPRGHKKGTRAEP